ncbi:lytic murein transglycosylase B [Shewanella eurypsychrophilus]|uniref:Lytic murein transglycosylase B n=1 Tax=Shewanella eurypsychrophilus TaxID=2593656 RepID=A0ABX6VCH1_9GAMM|nr:lytic murein transglycosylase B [Shewanella sp. YLB-09]QPG59243.1 lytic murein transglycosylase B [Shewanella eurypsychrophilus]
MEPVNIKQKILAPLFFAAFSATANTSILIEDSAVVPLKTEFLHTQQELGFTKQEVEQFLGKANYDQAVIDAMTKPWEAKPWHKYHPIFLTDKRLNAGLAFWNEHQATITKASEKFGVAPEIIIAIIGIETFYGGYMGNYPVVDALYTLGFYYPPRADFFRKELSNLQTLVKEEQLDINNLNGSYAGAMGFGQFIPSSYRHYAVDFDDDGRRDLLNNPVDAIGSVANYFHQHGWKENAPVVLPLSVDSELPSPLKVWAGEKLHYRAADILSPQVSLAKAIDLDISQPAMIVELEQENGNEYWLGLNNFYVITRYNRSPLYAMAVYQFSQELKNASMMKDD